MAQNTRVKDCVFQEGQFFIATGLLPPSQEIVGGMMDLEPRLWRKLIKENFDDQRKKVLQFAQWWKPYDCTKNEG